LLTLEVVTRAGAVIITAVGEVDLMTAPRLRDAAGQALAQPGEGPVVIDLTRVTHLASAGLQALLDAHAKAARAGEPLRIVVDHQRPVVLPLHVTGLDKVLRLYHSLDDALT
jgi:anti-sigma B factor antagonist